MLKNNYSKKHTTGSLMLDFIHIILLVAACFACYLAGQVSGAAGLAKLLIEHKFIKQEDFDKLHEILQSNK